MRLGATVSVLVLLSSFHATRGQSECSNYATLSNIDRSQNTHHNGNYLCDNGLGSGWYRISGNAGYRIPTSCVAKHYCTTHAPGWMTSPHPSVADGVVTRTVCYHWTTGCCEWSNNIRVRNCGEFYVYELNGTPHCYFRYCGNGAVPSLKFRKGMYAL
ncbi:predicted protein [Nematostella vectensis]|uniref:UMOD/GP2/OIT3-like D8C domain-containing protein n=1 Tax=Nematostella vectensis TaxID=45351 RepID=A7RWF8_NEMVE|nr:predicted protein [Nematostella vectensis]|eukprot:XP_001636316.1 predicted protein [Nematostella vectensis]